MIIPGQAQWPTFADGAGVGARRRGFCASPEVAQGAGVRVRGAGRLPNSLGKLQSAVASVATQIKLQRWQNSLSVFLRVK